MEQRDYLLQQIEKLGEVLSVLMGFKRAGQPDDGLKYTEYIWDKMLDEPFNVILETPEEKFTSMLATQQKLSLEELKIAAELLYHEGELHVQKGSQTKAKIAFFRALRLYEYLLKNDTLYDMGISSKIDYLKTWL